MCEFVAKAAETQFQLKCWVKSMKLVKATFYESNRMTSDPTTEIESVIAMKWVNMSYVIKFVDF